MFPTYSKMKDSGVEWIGDTPSHWQIKPLFSLFEEKEEKNNGMKVRDVLSLSYGRIVRRDVERNFGLLPESFETYQIIHPGDIILRLTDLQNDRRSLRVGLVCHTGIITSAYLCLSSKRGIHPSFGFYLLNGYDLLKVFYGFGGGVRQSMKFEDLRRLPILCPTEAEQRAIASFLDRKTALVDGLIAKRERQIELLQEQRTTLINHAVTKGLTTDVPMKDSGVPDLGEIPARWDVKRLKYLSSYVTSGSRGWAEHYSDDGPIFLRIGNIGKSTINLDLSEIQRVKPPDGAEVERTTATAGDVLVSITANVGAVGVVPEGLGTAYINQHIALVSPIRGRAVPRWLAYSLLSVVGEVQLARLFCGGSKIGLGLDDVRDIILPTPSQNEQRSIVAHIDRETAKINTFVAKVRESIEKLKEYRQSLISTAVTGKIDVRNWQPSSEPVEVSLHA